MKRSHASVAFLAAFLLTAAPPARAQRNPNDPTWWDKYTYLAKNGPLGLSGPTTSLLVATNVDVSNECGPQSETYVSIDTTNPSVLAGGSNEIFRLPMRGYFSSDGGATWGGVDLPLPPPIGANGIDFGSDPSLAFDTRGNVFYSYIVVYFGNGNGINGTSMAVARSTDGGKTYPAAGTTFFSFEGGQNHFNDKPMIAADTNLASPFRDNVYVAWDAASGGSTSGGVRFARSTDHGATFTTVRIDDPPGSGPVDRRRAVRGPGRRGLRRLERLRGERDRLQPVVRRRRHVGHAAHGGGQAGRVPDQRARGVQPRGARLPVLRRGPFGRPS